MIHNFNCNPETAFLACVQLFCKSMNQFVSNGGQLILHESLHLCHSSGLILSLLLLLLCVFSVFWKFSSPKKKKKNLHRKVCSFPLVATSQLSRAVAGTEVAIVAVDGGYFHDDMEPACKGQCWSLKGEDLYWTWWTMRRPLSNPSTSSTSVTPEEVRWDSVTFFELDNLLAWLYKPTHGPRPCTQNSCCVREGHKNTKHNASAEGQEAAKSIGADV